jgi:hypothetical protein
MRFTLDRSPRGAEAGINPGTFLKREEGGMKENLVTVSRDQILHRICGEYLEMPGLRLTLPQAQRLWGLDADTCAQLLQSLTDQQFLCRRSDGTYGRMAADVTAQGLRMAKAGQTPASPTPRAVARK